MAAPIDYYKTSFICVVSVGRKHLLSRDGSMTIHLPAAELFLEASATIFLNIKRGSMRMML